MPNPAALTPTEIDARLYTLIVKAERVGQEVEIASVNVRRAAGDHQKVNDGRRAWTMTLAQSLGTVGEAAGNARGREGVRARKSLRQYIEATERLAGLHAEMADYEAEFSRRGGWTRAYLARSTGGHVHSTTECSTCHKGEFRTQFTWQTAFSGKSEAEIVEAAGVRACTVCYPDAPVEALERPTQMFTEDEVAAQAARAEREQAKAQRAAAKDAKGITAVDGGRLRVDGQTFETERAAVLEATERLSKRFVNLRTEQVLEEDKGLEPFFLPREKRVANEESYRKIALQLIEAIAHKRSASVEEVLAELEPKALAKAKRDMGGKDFIANFRRNAAYQDEEYAAYVAACKAEDRTPFAALASRWTKF